jgi:hypothetical protein
MPTGKEFSEDLKQMMFRVILFVENEKNGPTIPLYNVNERLNGMLGISKQSISNLKKEMNEVQYQEDEKKSQLSRTRSTTFSSVVQPHRKQAWSSSSSRANVNVPVPLSPKKKQDIAERSVFN